MNKLKGLHYCIGVIVIMLVTFWGCQQGQVFNEHVEFSDKQWQKSKPLTFTPKIKEDSQEYKVYFDFRHVYGYQFENIMIQVKRVAPNGETQTENYDIQVAKSEDEYKSDCSGDICDLKELLEEETFSKAGKYKYVIEHTMPVDDLPNVMEVGLIIKKKSSK